MKGLVTWTRSRVFDEPYWFFHRLIAFVGIFFISLFSHSSSSLLVILADEMIGLQSEQKAKSFDIKNYNEIKRAAWSGTALDGTACPFKLCTNEGWSLQRMSLFIEHSIRPLDLANAGGTQRAVRLIIIFCVKEQPGIMAKTRLEGWHNVYRRLLLLPFLFLIFSEGVGRIITVYLVRCTDNVYRLQGIPLPVHIDV